MILPEAGLPCIKKPSPTDLVRTDPAESLLKWPMLTLGTSSELAPRNAATPHDAWPFNRAPGESVEE